VLLVVRVNLVQWVHLAMMGGVAAALAALVWQTLLFLILD
jgi:hypothetical protein